MFVPSKRTTAPLGGLTPSVGESRVTFFSVKVPASLPWRPPLNVPFWIMALPFGLRKLGPRRGDNADMAIIELVDS